MEIREFLSNPAVKMSRDLAAGDIILIEEPVFDGFSVKKGYGRFLGKRRILAQIIKESYGQEKGQHTFSLLVLDSDGYEHLQKGEKIRRKGRNVYGNLLGCIINSSQEQRDEKHKRKAEAVENKYWSYIQEAEFENKFWKLDKIPSDFIKKNLEEIKEAFPLVYKYLTK